MRTGQDWLRRHTESSESPTSAVSTERELAAPFVDRFGNYLFFLGKERCAGNVIKDFNDRDAYRQKC